MGVRARVIVLVAAAAAFAGMRVGQEDYHPVLLLLLAIGAVPALHWLQSERVRFLALLALFSLMWIDFKPIQNSASVAIGNAGLAELCIYAFAVGLLVQRLSRLEPLVRGPAVLWYSQALFVLGGVAALASTGFTRSGIEFWLRFCGLSTATLIVTTLSVDSAARAKQLLSAILVSALLVSFATAVAAKAGILLWSDAAIVDSALVGDETFRVGGALVMGPLTVDVHPITLGEFQVMAACIAMSFALATGRRSIRWLAGGTCALLLALFAAMSNSRAGLLAFLAGAAFVTLALARGRRFSLGSGVLLGLVGAGALAVAVYLLLPSDTRTFVLDRTVAALLDPGGDPNFQGRQLLWAEYTNLLAQNPLGMGFPYYTQLDNNPHDMWLYAGLGTGLAGALGFAGVVVVGLVQSMTGMLGARDDASVVYTAIGAALVTVLVAGLTSVYFHQQYKIVALYALVGCAVALRARKT